MKSNSRTRLAKPTRVLNRRVTRRKIAQVTQRIAEQFHPKKIILFGSYAYGRPHRDSDVDFLIVMNTKLRERAQRFEISRALYPRPFPMDILIETPQSLRHRLAIGDPFLREIVARGRVLYERTGR